MKFSVILPAWNRAATVEAAIGSVLAQTCRDFELVISDDGSTDETVRRLRERHAAEIAEGRIVLLEGAHAGVSVARNRACAAARGTWFAYVDSDNTVRPDFLERFAKAIDANPEARSFNAMFKLRSGGEERGRPYDRTALIERNYIDMGVFVHHRELYETLGGFDESMKRLVDWDLVLRYAEKAPPAFVDAVVLDYEDGKGGDRITSSRESFLAWRQVIWNRYAASLPSVTTVVTAYNQEAYIRESLDSALRQEGLFRHEIIVSDDGSSDATPAIVAAYAKKYPQVVKDLSNRRNRGISANMRKCFSAATGEYVAVLEGDDWWSDKRKLERQLEFLTKHRECPMVFSRTTILEPNGSRRYAKIQDGLPGLLTGREMFAAGSSSVILNFSSCMFRAVSLRGLPAVIWRYRLSEISLAYWLERRGPIGYLPCPMSVFRQHADSEFSGASFIERRRQEIACRKIAKQVCAPEYVADFEREIAHIDVVIRRRLEHTRSPGIRAGGILAADVFRRAWQCYCDNGFVYTLRRIFFGRQY